jgi:transcriptional regulator with XRE-family HTH domain
MGASPKTGDIELGRKVATRREELGMSRKDLASATHLSYPYIAQIETGYRLPSAKHHRVLAKALGLSLDELFGTGEAVLPPPGPERTRSVRRHRPTMQEAIEHAAREIEALPAPVRLEALSQVQLRIMTGVTDEQARRRD